MYLSKLLITFEKVLYVRPLLHSRQLILNEEGCYLKNRLISRWPRAHTSYLIRTHRQLRIRSFNLTAHASEASSGTYACLMYESPRTGMAASGVFNGRFTVSFQLFRTVNGATFFARRRCIPVKSGSEVPSHPARSEER